MRIRQLIEWSILVAICVAIWGAVGTISWAEILPNYEWVLNQIPETGMELFYAQASLTFISVSVLTMLSDKSIFIFWEDQVKKRLIEPKGFSFLSLTGYSFVFLVASFVAVVFGIGKKADIIAIIYFILNIVVLGILTFEMCGLFFNRDTRIRRLQKIFKKAYHRCNAFNEHFRCLIETRVDDFEKAIDSIDGFVEIRDKEIVYIEKELADYLKYTLDPISHNVSELVKRIDNIFVNLCKKILFYGDRKQRIKLLELFLKEFAHIRYSYGMCVLRRMSFFNNEKLMPLEDFRDFMREKSKIDEFTLKKTTMVIKTTQYIKNGDITQLIENLRLILENCKKFNGRDYSNICDEMTDVTKPLLFSELFMPMAEYRNLLGKELYWDIINKYFSEQSFLLLDYYVADARIDFCNNDEEMKLSPMDYSLRQLIKLAMCVLQEPQKLKYFKRTNIINNFLSTIWDYGSDDFTLILMAYGVFTDGKSFLNENRIFSHTENGYVDIKKIYTRYINGIKRIIDKNLKTEANKIFDSILNTYEEDRRGYKKLFDIYIEGIVFELEMQEQEFEDYDYEKFYSDFYKKIKDAMSKEELSCWNCLSEEAKARLSKYKYCYVSKASLDDAKVEAILKKIGEEVYFGEALFFCEEELRVWLYAYYKGYITDEEKTNMKLFGYESGVMKLYNAKSSYKGLKEIKDYQADEVKEELKKRIIEQLKI